MNNQNNSKNNKAFNIERIYLKSLSLKSPLAPNSFLFSEQPEVDIKFNINNSRIDNENHIYNSELAISVIAKLPKKSFDNILFSCDVTQSGIFLIKNFSEEEINSILNITAPEIIFPYIRETISSLIQKAGFAPLYINPVNFSALYYEKQQKINK